MVELLSVLLVLMKQENLVSLFHILSLPSSLLSLLSFSSPSLLLLPLSPYLSFLSLSRSLSSGPHLSMFSHSLFCLSLTYVSLSHSIVGVRNGMFIGQAKQLCPELLSVPYQFDKYEQVSYYVCGVCVVFVVLCYTSNVLPHLCCGACRVRVELCDMLVCSL